MIVQLADNRNYSVAKFIACEHALSSSQLSSSFIFNFLYTVKPRKEEPRKLRTNRLFLKILYLVKNQCQGVFE